MVSLPPRIPDYIIHNMILPYTYCPQPAILLEDLLSYHQTMTRVKTLYITRYPMQPDMSTSDDNSYLAWLSNDICRFLNDDQPTMYGYVVFNRVIFRRLYMNHTKDLQMICPPAVFGDGGDMFSDIKVSIGLLNPTERLRLERFLDTFVMT